MQQESDWLADFNTSASHKVMQFLVRKVNNHKKISGFSQLFKCQTNDTPNTSANADMIIFSDPDER